MSVLNDAFVPLDIEVCAWKIFYDSMLTMCKFHNMHDV